MSAIDQEPFPRLALVAVGSLVGLSLVATTAVRLARITAPSAPAAAQPAAVETIDLRFADQADGSIKVTEAASARLVATLAPDTNGFVRGVLRGLARDRISRGIGTEPPFRLSEDAAKHLLLVDTATGRRVNLEAFGTGNRASFMLFLDPKAAQS